MASRMASAVAYTTVLHAVHIYPTVTEVIPILLGNLKPL